MASHNYTAAEHMFDDYWAEYQDIKTNKHAEEEEEEYLSKTPDEVEQELDWLKDVGGGQVASTFEDGNDISEADLDTLMSSLTINQAAVVKRRVDTISATLKKRHKHAKTDVRDVFPNTQSEAASLQTSPDYVRRAESMYIIGRSQRIGSDKGRESTFLKRGGYDLTGDSDIIHGDNYTGGAELRFYSKNTTHCQFVTAENTQNGSTLHNDGLPNFALASDPLGVTFVEDLSRTDMFRIQRLALLELTIMLEDNGIYYTRRKPKRRSKDSGIFGVSLQNLLEFDRKREPSAKIPLVFEQLISHLDRTGLDSEGILRVPGSSGRVKQLRQDLEERFYHPDFSWEDVWPNDAATILKQLLRELPAPLLTHEYLEAFAQVESITEDLERLRALNLLILVLPESHRNTLLALLRFLQRVIDHIDENRMSLSSVAMIMAPNLFLVNSKSKNVREVEVNMAAGTSNIVRMLIKYQNLLWSIPPNLIMQIRQQSSEEPPPKNRDKLPRQPLSRSRSLQQRLQILKFRGKKDKPDGNRKYQITDKEFKDSGTVIRVQAPNLTKSCAAVQLNETTTAWNIVEKFRRQDDHRHTDKSEKRSSNGDKKHGHDKSLAFSNPDNATFAEDNTYLFELGGNIGERCLDPQTSMLQLYRINPNAEWVVKTRPSSWV